MKKEYFYYIAFVLALAWIYSPVLQAGAVLNRDDIWLLDPLWKIQSLSDYFTYLFSAENPDPQPLRDLSFLLDIAIEKNFSLRTFHAQNLFWWLSCTFLIGRLLKQNDLSPNWAMLFALHPFSVMTVAWISGRKHLLAFTFILAALLIALDWAREKNAKKVPLLCFFYLCSVFSQVIHILFPFWLVLLLYFRRAEKKKYLQAYGLCAISLALVYFEYRFYSASYQHLARNSGNIEVTSLNSLSNGILAVGRYFWNFFVPWQYSLQYSPSSLKNLLGIPIGITFLFLVIKKLGRDFSFLWLSLSALSLLLVLTKVHSIFLSDTYSLLFSLICFFLFLKIIPNRTRGYLIVFFFILIPRSHIEAKQWTSNLALWQHNYEAEPDCQSSANYALQLIEAKQEIDSITPIQFHLSSKCQSDITPDLYFFGVFYDPALTLVQKRDLLEKTKNTYANLLRLALEPKKNMAIFRKEILAHPDYFNALFPAQKTPLDEIRQSACAFPDALKIPYCDE